MFVQWRFSEAVDGVVHMPHSSPLGHSSPYLKIYSVESKYSEQGSTYIVVTFHSVLNDDHDSDNYYPKCE